MKPAIEEAKCCAADFGRKFFGAKGREGSARGHNQPFGNSKVYIRLRLARPQKLIQLISVRWRQFSFTKSDLMEALDILSTHRDERGGGVAFDPVG